MAYIMGIQERKQREKAELKAKIIKTATDIFLDKGYAATSIRNIASAIEYSPATIYLYFKDKKELFHIILEKAYVEFRTYLKGADRIADPFSRLQEICNKYLKFAKENPLFYDLIFLSAIPVMDSDQSLSSSEKIHQLFLDLVKECKKNSYFLSKDADSLAYSIWAYVHGLVVLPLTGRLKHLNKDQHSILEEQAIKLFFTQLHNS